MNVEFKPARNSGKTTLYVLVVVITGMLMFSGCSKAPQLPLLAVDATILAFGDSITYGTGASDSESYPAILATLTGRKVVNAGVPGEVSASGVQRLPELLERERPSLLVLCHGGNDLLGRADHQLIADNLRSMIRMTRDRGIAVLLVAVPSPDLLLKPPGLYEELANEFRIPLEQKSLPRILGTGSLKSDHIHPNATGYRQLAEAISTRYSHREHNYHKIADAVQRITALRKGNYFVFLPSFEFLERVATLFQPYTDFTVVRQERGMKAPAIVTIIENLRSQSVPTVVFAVQGGSFSEGMDYAGDTVIGAFVVGPPLPTFDLEREQMREFYQRKYGSGFDYAYTIPAMAKAVQAAGRVIRSETDKGLIILMDRRFLEPSYSQSMPADWFETNVSELVSDSILSDVNVFWAST
ncbi:MAG: helicase C-terminal domain-containing protein [Desulfuromonadaceae bacterium]